MKANVERTFVKEFPCEKQALTKGTFHPTVFVIGNRA